MRLKNRVAVEHWHTLLAEHAEAACAWLVRSLRASCLRFSEGSSSCGHQIGVEDSDLLQIRLLLCDELKMLWFSLILVIGLATFKKDVQHNNLSGVVEGSGLVLSSIHL